MSWRQAKDRIRLTSAIAPQAPARTSVGKTPSVNADRSAPSQQNSAPPPDSPMAAMGASSACLTICQRSKDLNCKKSQEQCLAACKEMHEVPICKNEMKAVMDCMISEPPAHWECNEEDIAAIKEGVCDDEQGGFMACVVATTTPRECPSKAKVEAYELTDAGWRPVTLPRDPLYAQPEEYGDRWWKRAK
jgi:hypothetical protein